MASGKILLVGAGEIGQLLLGQLDDELEIVCIDKDEVQLERLRELRPAGLTTVTGDATSRMQLEDLGLGEIDTVIISTTSEKINIEVARLVHEYFNVPQVIAVGMTAQGLKVLQKLEVEVESLFDLCAGGIANRLESKTRAAIGIGLGRNEILQVEVHPDSRLTNKKLSLFHPGSWRIGIIYRDEKIIVPHGSTVLRPHDKLVLLGEPRAIHTMAERLAFKFTDFPLEFGDTLVVLLPPGHDQSLLEETRYLCELLPVEKMLVVTQGDLWTAPMQEVAAACALKKFDMLQIDAGFTLESLPELIAHGGVRPALMIMGRKQLFRAGLPLLQSLRTKRRLQLLSNAMKSPLLLAAGSFPYLKTAVPALAPLSLERSLEASLEMATLANFALEVLVVEPSEYLGSLDDQENLGSMGKIVPYLARTYKKEIPVRSLQGNPIRSLLAALPGYQLLVGDVGDWKKPNMLGSLMAPDVGWEVIRQAQLSCLLIPPGEIFE